jgi:isochorismate synthase
MTSPAPFTTPAAPADDLLFRSRAVPVPDLLDLPEAEILGDASSPAPEPVFYWEHPSADEAWLAVGSVCEFVAAGPDRLREVRRAARAVLARSLPAPGETAAPRVVGGFAFAPDAVAGRRWREFPPAWFFLPRRLWLRHGRRCTLIECLGEASPRAVLPSHAGQDTSDESAESWEARVSAALDRIAARRLDKIVLSRARTFAPVRPPLLDVLRRLRSARPECVTFACKPAATTWFGSTPELMVERQEGAFFTPALAGTIRRSGDERVDRERTRELLACAKNRREHAAVVAGIRSALAPLGVQLDPAQEPHVITLPEALHLRTPISGRGAEHHDVLALAAALHPTPAVCGTPRAEAARLLHDEEPGRGWYTGGIGWMDAAGDGEVVVALRSALLADDMLSVFAGAGIVAGSDPHAEFAETELKMSAMLAPLRAATPGFPQLDAGSDDSTAEAVSA